METNQQQTLFELGLNEEGKSNFSSIAQWAFINAIVGFTALGITIISTFAVTSRISNPAAKGGGIFTVIITIVISLLLNVTLLAAANNLKKGLAGADQGYFNLGILKMASYFKILGILMIVILAIFALFMIIAMLAGAAGGFR